MKAADLSPLTLIPLLCQAEGWPLPQVEFQFHPPRKWRFDWCWVESRVALECEGSVWTQGRHTRGQGYLNDIDKYNQAQLDGYIVLRCTPQTAHLVAGLLREALA